MLKDVFLRDYFDSITNEEEPNHELNEVADQRGRI